MDSTTLNFDRELSDSDSSDEIQLATIHLKKPLKKVDSLDDTPLELPTSLPFKWSS